MTPARPFSLAGVIALGRRRCTVAGIEVIEVTM